MKIYNFSLLIIALCCFSDSVYAQQTFVQQDLGNNKRQGLKYIYDKAIEFMRQYNQEHQTHWKVMEPNAKTAVLKCAEPMLAKWGIVFVKGNKLNISIERYPIFIICNKDIAGKSLTVHVPTTRPDRITVHK